MLAHGQVKVAGPHIEIIRDIQRRAAAVKGTPACPAVVFLAIDQERARVEIRIAADFLQIRFPRRFGAWLWR